jgi:hypothetical protein
MTATSPRRCPPNLPVITPFHDVAAPLSAMTVTAPASAATSGASPYLFPFYLIDPFLVAKAFWCNGATVGVDSIDIGIYQMTDKATGRVDLIRSTGAVMSASPASAVQEAGWPQVTCVNVTSGNSSTDATSYATAIVNMAAGKLYLLSVENSKATADVVSSIDGGPTFTSRSSVAWNTNADRTSIWSSAPVANYTGVLTINFGGGNTQTGCVWSLEELSGADTASTDGIVQQNTGTGSSVTPQVTLGAFASLYNATYFACSNIADTTTTPKAQFIELVDISAATPLQTLETQWAPLNDTTPNGTITSGVWGACAVEIKAISAPATPWRVARTQLTSDFSNADATSYATASVTLKAGRLYLLAVENSKASADAVSAITGGSTFTSRATTQYNGTTNRITLLSSVPTVDVTGALTIDFGGGNTQTGCVWSLLECSGVNTATTDGIVQAVAATGNTANPSVALAAFGDARNATFSAFANLASAATPGPGWTEMADLSAATPAQFLETQWRVDSDRNASATMTSGQWGAIACEIACDTSSLVIPPSTPGNPDVYMAFACSASTATFLKRTGTVGFYSAAGVLTITAVYPLPSTGTASTMAAAIVITPLAGFSSRSLIG